MSEGIRKVNEYIMKTGRTIIITDPTIPLTGLPAGTLQVDPSAGTMKVKTISGTAWEVFDPVKLFDVKSIVTALLGDRSITSEKIALNGVVAENIKDSEVTTNKLADKAVTETKIADNSISTAILKAKAVTNAKIGDGAVANLQLADASVDARTLANNAVTTLKISDSNITYSKLDSGLKSKIDAVGVIYDGTVTYAKLDTTLKNKMDLVGVIADGSIAYAKLDSALKTRIDLKTVITVSATAPVAPAVNDFWLDTSI